MPQHFFFFFLPRQILEIIDHRYASAKAPNAAMVKLNGWIIKMIMWLTVHCFYVSNKHVQSSNVIWLSTTWLLIFRLEVANKKPLFTTKSASRWIEISCKKDIIFHSYKLLYPTPGCYTGKLLFALVSRIINSFLTEQPDILKIICNLSKWVQERACM